MITKEAVVLIYDNGSSCELARLLVPKFKKVYYFTPWTQSGFPDYNPRFIGVGIPGVEKVEDLWKVIDNETVDLIIFTDVYDGDLADHLRKIGKHVVSSFYGKKFELDRSYLQEFLKSKGLPVNDFTPIKGITKLREYLKDKEKKFIKISNLRGITETMQYINERISASELDDISYRLGDLREQIEFLVQDPIGDDDMVEFGCDTFFAGGKFAENMLCGIETKDCSYTAKFINIKDVPEPIKVINTAFTEAFSAVGYQQHFSTEIRYGKEKKPYFIDSTCRMPHPPVELMQYMYENIADIYMGLGMGQIVEPITKYKFGVQVIIHSEFSEDHFISVEIHEKYRNNVFLKNYVVIDGVPRVIPQPYKLQEIGAVVACGNTLEEAIENVKGIIGDVKTRHLDFPSDKLDEVFDHIELMDKLGVNFYSDKPTAPAKEPEKEPEEKKPEPIVVPAKVNRFLKTITR